MATRAQVILTAAEREMLRREAARKGQSLSAWMRKAALDRAAEAERRQPTSVKALRVFFSKCDRRELGREPDWQQHLTVMARSRMSGGSDT